MPYTAYSRPAWAAALVPLTLTALTALTQARPPGSSVEREVRLLTLDGVINPLTARYLERELREAASSRAALVVLRLDTPGGFESSMRKMTEAILASRGPVAVYVAPPGARAAKNDQRQDQQHSGLRLSRAPQILADLVRDVAPMPSR